MALFNRNRYARQNSSNQNDIEADGLVLVMEDENVIEMLEAYIERFPKFSKEISKTFWDMPSQTLLHGDFHNGNHMYLEEDGKFKVVAFDFQTVGQGVAVSDLVTFIILSIRSPILLYFLLQECTLLNKSGKAFQKRAQCFFL